jgi:death-on-curing family protein
VVIQINEEILKIVHKYVVTKLIANEGIVYSGTISGSIIKVFARVYGGERYKGIHQKAGALLYSIVHGHSFVDGNKRTGLLSACLFLLYNGYYLRPPPDTAKFLEKMADAQNPAAPTESDAINWIIKHTNRNPFSLFVYLLVLYYCKTQGIGILMGLTSMMLEQNQIPFVKSEELIDQSLKKARDGKKDAVCAE